MGRRRLRHRARAGATASACSSPTTARSAGSSATAADIPGSARTCVAPRLRARCGRARQRPLRADVPRRSWKRSRGWSVDRRSACVVPFRGRARSRRGRRRAPARALGRRRGRRAVLDERGARRARRPSPRRRSRASSATHGPLMPDAAVEPESHGPSHLAWWLRGERGRVRVEILMSPERPPRVQGLTITSVPEPPPQLADIAVGWPRHSEHPVPHGRPTFASRLPSIAMRSLEPCGRQRRASGRSPSATRSRPMARRGRRGG